MNNSWYFHLLGQYLISLFSVKHTHTQTYTHTHTHTHTNNRSLSCSEIAIYTNLLSKLNVGDFESVATLTGSVTCAMRLAIILRGFP
jgi:hypothetical protein